MNSLYGDVVKYVSEILYVVVATVGSMALHKVKSYFDSKKKLSNLGIIDHITDQVVEWAEVELTDASGADKREFAVKYALDILASKGIHVDEAEVVAGIENGVNKLRQNGHEKSTPVDVSQPFPLEN